MLVDGNNRFTMKKESGGEIQWRCAFFKNRRYICKVKATTYKDKNGNHLASFRGAHNHRSSSPSSS